MKISVLTPSIRPEGLLPVQESLNKQTLTDFEWLVELGIPGRGHDLNAAFNRMLKRAQGELIVFYEDYTQILPEGLQNFWEAYQKNPNTFFTAPLGKKKNLKDENERPHFDWREYPEGEASWQRWEIDWGAAPLKILKEIGGFDETLDQYWSSDNVNTAFRAHLTGVKFMNLHENKAVALDHDAVMEHPFRKNYNPEFNSERLSLFEHGLKLDPL